MKEKLSKIANKYNINFYDMWGIEGGNGWIWYKQDDEKKFRVQVYIHGNFELYESIKSEIINLFLSYNCSLAKEQNLHANFGCRKNLYFMDTEELQTQINKKEQDLKKSQIHTYNIGQINAQGGIITLGDVVNSTQSIENSIQRIENLIEEKGGDDKEELHSILNETKEIINEISETKEIKPKKGFIEKLSNHISKHGWFYGSIITLLGTAVLEILKLGGY